MRVMLCGHFWYARRLLREPPPVALVLFPSPCIFTCFSPTRVSHQIQIASAGDIPTSARPDSLEECLSPQTLPPPTWSPCSSPPVGERPPSAPSPPPFHRAVSFWCRAPGGHVAGSRGEGRRALPLPPSPPPSRASDPESFGRAMSARAVGVRMGWWGWRRVWGVRWGWVDVGGGGCPRSLRLPLFLPLSPFSSGMCLVRSSRWSVAPWHHSAFVAWPRRLGGEGGRAAFDDDGRRGHTSHNCGTFLNALVHLSWLLARTVTEKLSRCIDMAACCVFLLLTCRRAVLCLLSGLLTSLHVLAGRACRVGGAARN